MSTKTADLHIHTHYSDSTLSPAEVVREAHGCGLSAISITDHDTLDGIAPAQSVACDYNLEIISGIELSAEAQGRDIHILGYFVDCADNRLQKELADMRSIRVKRIRQMVDKLKEQGVNNIDPQEVLDLTKSDAVGRMHLAVILKQKGWVSSTNEAFARFIGEKSAAYVPKLKKTPRETIELIREAGGVAVLAHPMVNGVDELIPSFVEAGLEGLEVYYPNTSDTAIRFYESIARKHNLVATGGSDAHGYAKDAISVGDIRVSIDVVEELRALKKK